MAGEISLELMISDPERARGVAEAAEALVRELMLALESARLSEAPSEVEVLKRKVGLLIGRLEMELFFPLYSKFPSLEPASRKESGPDEL